MTFFTKNTSTCTYAIEETNKLFDEKNEAEDLKLSS